MRNLLFAILVLLVSGCVVSEKKHQSLVDEVTNMKAEIATIRESIGEWGYIAIDPQLSFSVKDVVFSAGEYNSVQIAYKASVKQNNQAFALKNYQVMVNFSVLDKNSAVIDSFTQAFNIEDGLAALAEIKTMYGGKANPRMAYTIKVNHYEWRPTSSFKPYDGVAK